MPPPRMSVCGWEALPDVREWSGGPPGYPGVPPDVCVCLGGFLGCLGVVGRPPDVRVWLEAPLRYPGVIGRPFRMSGSGREHLLDIQE